MAILRGPYGTGYVKRLGATVGQKAGQGKYKIYAYQPEVVNPRSYGQRVQRAKFSFLGYMAGMFTDAGLVGLERQPYTSLRNAFMSLNMKNVVMNAAPDDESVNVSQSAELVMLSKGYEPAPKMVSILRSYNTLSLNGQTTYSDLSQAPDVFIGVIIIDKLIGIQDYFAQVVTATYSTRGATRASFALDDIRIDTRALPATGETYRVYVYGYNMRYTGNRLSAGVGTLGFDEDAQVPAFELTSAARNLYAKHLYSPTALNTVAWAGQ